MSAITVFTKCTDAQAAGKTRLFELLGNEGRRSCLAIAAESISPLNEYIRRPISDRSVRWVVQEGTLRFGERLFG
jgi:hypothetical protein